MKPKRKNVHRPGAAAAGQQEPLPGARPQTKKGLYLILGGLVVYGIAAGWAWVRSVRPYRRDALG
jgi:hypothetical protein